MLIDQVLERDLKWREAELASLKKHAALSVPNSVERSSLLRALLAMLYAHYEGFTKFCWETLLDHIQSEGVSRSQLTKPFAMLSLEGEFKSLRGNTSSDYLWDFAASRFNAALERSARFEEGCRPSTESNLWPNVYEREAQKMELSCVIMDGHRQTLKSLVSRRNDIAHGKENMLRDLDEYQKFEEAVVSVMHELALSVLSSAEEKSYLLRA